MNYEITKKHSNVYYVVLSMELSSLVIETAICIGVTLP